MNIIFFGKYVDSQVITLSLDAEKAISLLIVLQYNTNSLIV